MKRTLGALLLTFGFLTSVGALDEKRMAGLEAELAVLMQTDDPTALQALDAQMTSQLGPAIAPLAWVKAGIVSHNLSRTVGNEAHRGNAARAVDRLKTAARGSDSELAAVALPYLGSATSLQATEDSNPVSKLLFVNQGWSILGEAVDKYGEGSFLPRMIRVRVGSSLPDFFGKNDEVLKDLTALDAWDKVHPGRMPDAVKAQMALIRGNTYKKQKDLNRAVEAWTRAAALDPQKIGAGKEASAALDRYGN
jgi:hypothetical protein